MNNLESLVEPLKRAVAVPGTFAETFPSTSNEDLVDLAADAMAEAQLDGFLSDHEVNLNTFNVTPDLTPPQQALVTIYGGYRILINEIRNRSSRVKYEAGPTSFEEEQTASMLNEVLRQLNERKKDLLAQARLGQLATGTYVSDMYFHKATGTDFRLGWYLDLSQLAFAYQEV